MLIRLMRSRCIGKSKLGRNTGTQGKNRALGTQVSRKRAEKKTKTGKEKTQTISEAVRRDSCALS